MAGTKGVRAESSALDPYDLVEFRRLNRDLSPKMTIHSSIVIGLRKGAISFQCWPFST